MNVKNPVGTLAKKALLIGGLAGILASCAGEKPIEDFRVTDIMYSQPGGSIAPYYNIQFRSDVRRGKISYNTREGMIQVKLATPPFFGPSIYAQFGKDGGQDSAIWVDGCNLGLADTRAVLVLERGVTNKDGGAIQSIEENPALEEKLKREFAPIIAKSGVQPDCSYKHRDTNK